MNYSKGLTLTAKELKELHMTIEMKISNRMTAGCNTESFDILKGIKKRIEECQKK